ncbi:MAG: hypothetical protein WCO05_01140 [Candidatus Moraniibacteriota bacterium]
MENSEQQKKRLQWKVFSIDAPIGLIIVVLSGIIGYKFLPHSVQFIDSINSNKSIYTFISPGTLMAICIAIYFSIPAIFGKTLGMRIIGLKYVNKENEDLSRLQLFSYLQFPVLLVLFVLVLIKENDNHFLVYFNGYQLAKNIVLLPAIIFMAMRLKANVPNIAFKESNK